jgi:nucleoside-diphosphate-sugar epimerase
MSGGVAILGAGGFVGARVLEMATLGGRTDLVPVVRAYRSIARIAHLGASYRLGDASRPASLESALAGCDAVVNLTMDDADKILPTTKNIYAAAVAAGARVLVHLSSAAVFGQVDRSDLPDDAPPQLDHWMPYAREKGRAEEFLRERMADGRLAIVVLRPGLVWGPGSPWVLGPATDLLRGAAYLVGEGRGSCNLVFIDNLVRSIDAVVTHSDPMSGFYNVADDEKKTWRDYYTALAAGLGVEMSAVPAVADDRYHAGPRDLLATVQSHTFYRWLKDLVSAQTRSALKLQLAAIRGRSRAASEWNGTATGPAVTREMWHLQTTRYPLPNARFRAAFGDQNETSFASAMAASLAWLRFIGLDDRDDKLVLGAAARVGAGSN